MSCLEPTVVFMLPLLKTRNKQSSKLKILKYDLFHIPDRVESEIGDCDYPLIAGDGFCDDEANNHQCDFDDGDCCGTSDFTVNTNNCLQCMCFGM